MELLAASRPEAVCHRPSQFLGVLSGFLHQPCKRVTVLCPVFRHHPADAILAVLIEDPAHLLQDGAMVVEKRREDLAAHGTPALGGKLV